jgi:uncharacterized protein (TIGR02996 family)
MRMTLRWGRREHPVNRYYDGAMSEELLAKVLAKPEDDKARAAYAAALHAAGDPRGEFIDLQCDFAKHKDQKTPAAQKLAKRIADLHKKNAAKWAKPLRALGKGVKWEFKRGFVDQVTIDYPADPRIAALNDVFAVEPVTDLVVSHMTPDWWKSALASAGMLRVRRLVVFTLQPHNNGVVKTLRKAPPPSLQELRIGLIGDGAMEDLGQVAPHELKHLAIGGGGHSVKLTEKGVATLLASPLGKQLETLELGRCAITPRMANAVCGSTLKRFSASTGEFDEVEDQLKARFKKNFVVEDEDSFDYLLYGSKGISR